MKKIFISLFCAFSFFAHTTTFSMDLNQQSAPLVTWKNTRLALKASVGAGALFASLFNALIAASCKNDHEKIDRMFAAIAAFAGTAGAWLITETVNEIKTEELCSCGE